MVFDLDVAIVAGFLLVNLLVGIVKGQKIKTIKEYAIGSGDFSTAAIVSTIVATWISGSFFFNRLAETYTNGLYFMWAAIGTTLELMIVGVIFVPRMKEFMGKLSVAEAMGDMYGNKARLVTSISGFIGTIGYIAVQLKVSGLICEYCFDIHGFYGIALSAIVITFYSSLGGIKSVTFTDLIQFITFSTLLPTIAFFLLSNTGSLELVSQTLATNENFRISEVFDFTRPKSFYYLFLFLYMSTPIFNPPIFQRISMARDIKQASISFISAGIICFFLTLIVFWIGILVFSVEPDLNPDNIVKYIISNYSYVGLKGFTLAGILAMVMSTADSYINSTAVIFIHDFCKSLKIKFIKNELQASRIASFLLGLFGFILAIKGDSIIDIVITTYSFYMPIVTVPFIVGVLGFRANIKPVLIGMGGGFTVAVVWIIFDITFIDAIVPGMIVNLIFLVTSHYILGLPGGWVNNQSGIKNKNKKNFMKNLFDRMLTFSFYDFYQKCTPTSERVYLAVGFFSMVMVYSTINILSYEARYKYSSIIEFIIPFSLILSTLLFSYPVWLKSWKNNILFNVFIWNTVVFLNLVCFSFLFVLMGNFNQMHLMVFMVNLILLSTLFRWQWLILMVPLGMSITTIFLNYYLDNKGISIIDNSFKFEIMYLLFLFSSILVVFFKPKQEYIEATEKKVKYLESDAKAARSQFAQVQNSIQTLQEQFEEKADTLQQKEKFLLDQLKIRNEEVSKLSSVKDEFIRNVMHESNTPMTSILTLSDILYTYYDKLDKKEIKQSIKDIVNGGERLKTYISSITDLSKLSSLGYKLKYEEVNLSQLIQERPFLYKKIFSDECEQQNFVFDVQPDIKLRCDKYYVTHMLDNLISNAVKYGNNNPIRISLRQDKHGKVTCEIRDQGIGIPQNELISIFDKFTVSSRTISPAEGRGVGLALVNKIITMHGGRIWAESDGQSWSVFRFVL